MSTLQDITLQELLPSSIAGDETIQDIAAAVEAEIAAVTGAIDQTIIYPDLDRHTDAVLDAIAWGFHVDGYDLATSRAERLDYIRQFFRDHQLKGTVAGYRRFFRSRLHRELLGASPPHKSFAGAGLTEAERAAWEAPHPEIRIRPFVHTGTAGRRLFTGRFTRDSAGPVAFPAQGDAILRIGDQVSLYDPRQDTETPLHTLEVTRAMEQRTVSETVQVRLPGTAHGLYAGRPLAGCAVKSTAASRVYTLKLARPYANPVERRQALAVTPSLSPIRAGYDVWQIPGQARGLFAGNKYTDVWPDRGGGYVGVGQMVGSTAGLRLGRTLKLFDPDRAVWPSRERIAYAGAMRLGALPVHTGELAVDMTRRANRLKAFVGQAAGRYAASSTAGEWIGLMCRVGRMASRFSDKILVHTRNHRVIRASSSILAGTAVCGEYTLEVII